MITVCIGLLSAVGTASAQYWVDDPNDCPVEYQSQTCTGSDVVCGYDSGITYCYDPASIGPPGSEGQSSTSYSGSFDGGFILNCYAYDGSAPHCDNSANFWCDVNSTCTTWHKLTNCTAGAFGISWCDESCNSGYGDCNDDSEACEVQFGVTNYPSGANNHYDDCSTCGCDTNYKDCDASGCDAGSGCDYRYNTAWGTQQTNTSTCHVWTCNTNYYDCDADGDDGPGGTGCELLDGSSCSIGAVSGTYNCYADVGGSCTDGSSDYTCDCDVSPQDIATTGQLVSWSGDQMLWMKNYGTGYSLNITTKDGSQFLINDSGIHWNWDLLNVTGAASGGDIQTSTYYNESRWNPAWEWIINESVPMNTTNFELFNETMMEYVDSQNTVYNDTIYPVIDSRDLYYNGTIYTVIDSRDNHYNSTLFPVIDSRDLYYNGTIYDVIDSRDQHYNNTIYPVIDSRDQTYNDTIYPVIISVNTTNTNAWWNSDILFNNSIVSWASSMFGYINPITYNNNTWDSWLANWSTNYWLRGPTGNTSAEIQTVINANPTGNTSAEIQTVINANPTGNTSAEIQAVINANPTGNTTKQIQDVITANGVSTISNISTSLNYNLTSNGAMYYNGSCLVIEKFGGGRIDLC